MGERLLRLTGVAQVRAYLRRLAREHDEALLGEPLLGWGFSEAGTRTVKDTYSCERSVSALSDSKISTRISAPAAVTTVRWISIVATTFAPGLVGTYQDSGKAGGALSLARQPRGASEGFFALGGGAPS
jgi:hypothetical protein